MDAKIRHRSMCVGPFLTHLRVRRPWGLLSYLPLHRLARPCNESLSDEERDREQSSSPSLLGDLSSRLQSSATDCSSTASTATCDRVSPRRFCTLPRWGRWGRHRPSWIRRLGAFFNALFGLRGCCGLWIVTSVFEQLVRHIMCGLRFISASAALVTRSSNPHDTMNCICIK